MEKRDARTLKIAAQQELRNQVVRMRKKGMKNPEVAILVGLSPTTTSGIWSKYKKGGMKALPYKKEEDGKERRSISAKSKKLN